MSQGVNAAETDSSGVVAELGDGVGEPLAVQAGRIAERTVLIDPLAPVGHD
ncbi:hypothetical protein [Streptomyces sp. NPDC056405]|uniref:hypothetical protein n=1 Tax=Streptomyces sp. NPDC056405 TaxID=3345811 RepID=UPI0035DE09B2